MTREEAIMILKNEQPHCGEKITFTESEKYDAYNLAINALYVIMDMDENGIPCDERKNGNCPFYGK